MTTKVDKDYHVLNILYEEDNGDKWDKLLSIDDGNIYYHNHRTGSILCSSDMFPVKKTF